MTWLSVFQETRPAFSMTQYREKILNSFPEETPTIKFDEILEGQSKFEAFRTFVSALILVSLKFSLFAIVTVLLPPTDNQ